MKSLFFFLACILSAYSITGMFKIPHQTSLFSRVFCKSFANIHLDAVKGLYNGLSPQAKKVSPVLGIAYMNSTWIKNAYRFGDSNLCATRLVNDPKYGIFNLLDNHFLRPTQNKSNPGYDLTSHLIGSIVGALETDVLTNETVKKNIIYDLRKSFASKADQKITAKKATEFIDIIIQATQESGTSQHHYLERMPQMMLLSYLSRIADTKQSLIEYLKALSNYMPVLKENYSYEQLLVDMYTVQDRKEHQNRVAAMNDQELCRALYDDEYEAAVHTIVTSKQLDTHRLPQVFQGSYSYQGQAAAPDCVETAVREICNHLFWNSTLKKFDAGVLPKKVSPLQNLSLFYTNFYNVSSINNHQTGQAWMDLVSNIKGVVYSRGNYEVDSSEENISLLLNRLFGTQAKTLYELGQILSDEHRTVVFTKHPIQKDEKNVVIDILFHEKMSQISRTLTLNIIQGLHAFVTRPHDDSQQPLAMYPGYSISEDIGLHATAASLAALLGSEKFYSLPNTKHQYITHSLLANSDLDNPQKRLQPLQGLLRWLKNYPQLLPLSMNIIQSLPDDRYFHESVGRVIAQEEVLEYFTDFLLAHKVAANAGLRYFAQGGNRSMRDAWSRLCARIK